MRLRGEQALAAIAQSLERGFTLVELALTVALIGILSTIAVSGYANYQERARNSHVIVDIKNLATEIDGYEIATGQLPSTLAQAGVGGMIDIWGNPYQYLRLDPKDNGQPRKDKFIVPINSDYDLYSMGPDGRSVAPLTSKSSRDDIVRASNGSYIGVAERTTRLPGFLATRFGRRLFRRVRPERPAAHRRARGLDLPAGHRRAPPAGRAKAAFCESCGGNAGVRSAERTRGGARGDRPVQHGSLRSASDRARASGAAGPALSSNLDDRVRARSTTSSAIPGNRRQSTCRGGSPRSCWSAMAMRFAIYLARRLEPTAESSVIAVGEVAPDYLFDISHENALPPLSEFVLLDGENQVLTSSWDGTQGSAPAHRSRCRRTREARWWSGGSVGLRCSRDPGRSSSDATYGHPSWTIDRGGAEGDRPGPDCPLPDQLSPRRWAGRSR